MQPYHAIDDGRWAEKRIGPARMTTYAFRSLLDAGARLAFGSDWTVAPLDPIQGIYAAVTRRTLDGRIPDGWVPEQKITVEEALRAYTAGGAFAASRRTEGNARAGKAGRLRGAVGRPVPRRPRGPPQREGAPHGGRRRGSLHRRPIKAAHKKSGGPMDRQRREVTRAPSGPASSLGLTVPPLPYDSITL